MCVFVMNFHDCTIRAGKSIQWQFQNYCPKMSSKLSTRTRGAMCGGYIVQGLIINHSKITQI